VFRHRAVNNAFGYFIGNVALVSTCHSCAGLDITSACSMYESHAIQLFSMLRRSRWEWLQGFSVDWWKSKHNKHHAAPNELDENFQVQQLQHACQQLASQYHTPQFCLPHSRVQACAQTLRGLGSWMSLVMLPNKHYIRGPRCHRAGGGPRH
jgi:hypothetical protein